MILWIQDTPGELFHNSIGFIAHIHLEKSPEEMFGKGRFQKNRTWKVTGQTKRLEACHLPAACHDVPRYLTELLLKLAASTVKNIL